MREFFEELVGCGAVLCGADSETAVNVGSFAHVAGFVAAACW